MTEQELYDYLFNKVCDSKDAHYEAAEKGDYSKPFYQPEAYVELAKDVTLPIWDPKVSSKLIGEKKFKAGTTMRVVMASSMGDLGLTRDLNAKTGYELRLTPGDGYMTNCGLTR